jgi:kanamycin kinase
LISFSGPPAEPVAVPAALRPWLGTEDRRAVWVNEIGGLTFEDGTGSDHIYAKWAPAHPDLDLAAEAERLRWAGPYVSVPEVISYERVESGEILVTRAIPGSNAVVDRWRAEPATAVRVLGSALRTFHESLPVAECPFSWTIESRTARTRRDGIPDRVAALETLPPAPAVAELVVCHGDACAPNTVLGDDGTLAGFVDLSRLGVGDRWADIAVGAMSTEWNYGLGWCDLYYESYGVEPDDERIAFYRALWDAT